MHVIKRKEKGGRKGLMENLFTGISLVLSFFIATLPPEDLLSCGSTVNNSKRHRTKIGPAELCNTRHRNFIVC